MVKLEIDLAAEILSGQFGLLPRIETVFFGGGTPTILPVEDLAGILRHIKSVFTLSENPEITTEANPDTVDRQYIADLVDSGFNRISFGMQSAKEHVLKVLDRTHTEACLERATAASRHEKLEFSLDLIYGTPGESLDDWKESLKKAVDYAPGHISMYALSVEKGTRLYRQVTSKEIPAPDPDLQADMYIYSDQFLHEAGYRWYEISNFSKDYARRCRHNLNYWHGGNWWGCGPGAVSQISSMRWKNVKHPFVYASRLNSQQNPAEGFEELTEDQKILERLMLGLRLSSGLETEYVPNGEAIPELIDQGLLSERAGRIFLTLNGRLLANSVIARLTF